MMTDLSVAVFDQQDGCLDQAGRDELLEALRADPQKREEWCRLQRTHIALQTLYARRSVDSLVERIDEVLRCSTTTGRQRLVGLIDVRLRRRRRQTMAVLLVLLGIGLGGWLLWSRSPAPDPWQPVLTAGVVVGDGTDWTPGDVLPVGVDLHIADDVEVELSYPDASSVQFAGPATVAIADATDGRGILLREGRLMADIRPQPDGIDFRVTGPHAQARVIGTRFSLAVHAQGSRLQVSEGRVAWQPLVGSAVAEQVLGAGEEATVLDPQEIEATIADLIAAGPLLTDGNPIDHEYADLRSSGQLVWQHLDGSWHSIAPEDDGSEHGFTVPLAGGDQRIGFPLPGKQTWSLRTSWMLFGPRGVSVPSDFQVRDFLHLQPWPPELAHRGTVDPQRWRQFTVSLVRRRQGRLADWYELLYDAGGQVAWHGLACGDPANATVDFTAVPEGKAIRVSFQAPRLWVFESP